LPRPWDWLSRSTGLTMRIADSKENMQNIDMLFSFDGLDLPGMQRGVASDNQCGRKTSPRRRCSRENRREVAACIAARTDTRGSTGTGKVRERARRVTADRLDRCYAQDIGKAFKPEQYRSQSECFRRFNFAAQVVTLFITSPLYWSLMKMTSTSLERRSYSKFNATHMGRGSHSRTKLR
jgi:hypothetical protein